MKIYLLVIVLLSLILSGCSDKTDINSSLNSNVAEPNWISIPRINDGSSMSVSSMPIFVEGKLIDGKKGGKIKIEERYNGGPLGEVKVKAELEFLKDAFDGDKYITMVLNTEFGNATFSPHSFFDRDAIYNVEFKGLDLMGINPKHVGFVYQAEDGSYENIDYSKIEVDIKKGKLKVKDAKLPHFSRYGFVSKESN